MAAPANAASVLPGTATPSLSLGRSLLIALLIEALVLGGGAALVARERASTPAEQRVELVFDNPPEPKKEEPKPEPPPPEIKPKLVPVKAAPVRPATPQPKAEPPLTPPTEAPAPTVAAASVAVPVAPPPAPPVPPANHDAEREAEFAERLKAAIRAAVVYPAAARNMGLRGQVRVEFYFRDGVRSRLRVVQGSGSGMLDQAALTTVSAAAVPPLPESLKGREMTYQVTVTFDLKG